MAETLFIISDDRLNSRANASLCKNANENVINSSWIEDSNSSVISAIEDYSSSSEVVSSDESERCSQELSRSSSPVAEEEDDLSKYSFFPIKYHTLENFYQRQKDMFWTPAEIDFRTDRLDYEMLDENSREFIKFILLFFSQADGIINENLIDNFKKETSCYKEAGHFYAAQEFMEVIHNETYSMLIETLIRDPEEKAKAFNAIKYYPSIRKIADWIFEWMKNDRPLMERVIAFACVEGMMFSGAFAAIYWIKRRNILKGLTKSNEWISKDEGLHFEFAIELYRVMTRPEEKHEPLSEKRVYEIIGSAMNATEDFTRHALKVDLIGMNADDMISYVKCIANNLSESLGYRKLYEVENPFDWMAVIGLSNKSNMFETVVSEYARVGESNYEFKLDSEF